jgi:hypothetical protein
LNLKENKELLADILSEVEEAYANGLLVQPRIYYNKVCDISYPIALIIQRLLISEYAEYRDSGEWMDDCLIEKLDYNNGVARIWGIVISGVGGNSTEQYTDPFYLEISNAGNEYLVLFADADRDHVSYNDDRFRDVWNRDFYSSANWDIRERNWLYELRSTV